MSTLRSTLRVQCPDCRAEVPRLKCGPVITWRNYRLLGCPRCGIGSPHCRWKVIRNTKETKP